MRGARWIFVLLACLGCDKLSARNPALGIEALKTTEGYVFKFRNCLNAEPIQIHWIKVIPPVELDKADEVAPLCDLEFDPRGGGEPITDTWQYGSVPLGYSLKSPCEKLKSGMSYRILTGHQGSLAFVIDGTGNIKVGSRSCSK